MKKKKSLYFPNSNSKENDGDKNSYHFLSTYYLPGRRLSDL